MFISAGPTMSPVAAGISMNEEANPQSTIEQNGPAKGPGRRQTRTIGLIAAGFVAGGILAGTLGASAATSSTSPTAAASSSAAASHTADCRNKGQKAVSAALTTSLSQKALAQVPGGKVIRVETGSNGAAYEVHVTKADGSRVIVTFDKTLKFLAVTADQRRAGLHHGFAGAGARPGYQG